jgi:hypothetical protein
MVIPFVLLPVVFRNEERKGDPGRRPSVTSTVYGVSITYPDDWTLLQLNDRLETDGTETSSLFQLSNVDPLDGRRWVCPLPSGDLPEGGVVLFVQQILTPTAAPAWPVELGSGRAVFDTCGRRVARWQAGGRTFEAGVVGDLDGAASREVVDAFRSMTFQDPDDDEPLGWGNTHVSNAYVIASGRDEDDPWNLLAFGFREGLDDYLCILVDPIGPRRGNCMPNPVQNYPFAFELSVADVGGHLLAFGKVYSSTDGVETMAGRPLRLDPLPAGMRLPFAAFVGPADEEVADGVALVEVRRVDSFGNVAERQQWIEPSSVEAGAAGVKAFGQAFGELWWLFDDGRWIYLKQRGGWILRARRALDRGEHLQTMTHTFQQETARGVRYESVVFGVSSGEASQVTVMLTTGDAVQASVRTLEYEVGGPDMLPRRHVFWLGLRGPVRGEIVAVDTGCRVLERETLEPETSSPPLASPSTAPEIPCTGP